ncbi:unnamed protein product [Euphydryas editha]|uniref:Uncharacterized protein n=1 Tax=Euphydryas editha TaxID=104508 RepID=A0AAU9UKE0_EUPED|nr:unnamed protein product [Euphydryas editha]
MECPCRLTVLSTLFFFSIQTVSVFCQNESIEETTQYQTRDLKRDVSKQFFSPSIPNIQDDRSRSVNVVSQGPFHYSQDPAVYNQLVGPSTIPNLALSTQYSTMQPEQQSCNGVTEKPLENYPNLVPQISTVWQLSQPSNDIYNYPPMISQISPPSLPSATINTQPSVIDFFSKTNEGVMKPEPKKFQNRFEDGIPLNLQINIPSQNVPVPAITVVTAKPDAFNSANSDAVLTYPQYLPPPQPIIVKKSPSCIKSLLPILLIALLSDQGCCGNRCCCPCNCNDTPILIPYPIPIPINNPIINNDSCSYSSRDRGNRDNEDDNDEE